MTPETSYIDHKQCSSCLISKPLTAFSRTGGRPYSKCKVCRCEELRRWRVVNLEKTRAYERAQYRKHREKRIAAAKRYELANKEKVDQKKREWAERNREHIQKNTRRKNLSKFGVSEEWYESELQKQGGKCAICGSDRSFNNSRENRFAVDHNHSCCSPGHACDRCRRGLLCFRCNTRLSHIENRDYDWMSRAMAYLGKYPLKD